MLLTRQSGALLPLSSLPGPAHCGDLGPAARRFIDHLAAHEIRVWQFLPLHPTEQALCNSPYSAQSIYAGDERYISIEDLVTAGHLAQAPAATAHPADPSVVDYAAALAARHAAVDAAFQRISASAQRAFVEWRISCNWVESYATWRAIANAEGTVHWTDWPAVLRNPDSEEVKAFQVAEKAAISRIAFGQFLWSAQWAALRRYAEQHSVKLFGDVPIYPHLDSADVWAAPANFKLDRQSSLPEKVAGVPPDYFSEDGQLWGNPVYDWEYLEKDGFQWWVERLRAAFQTFHLVRVDHFIGLVRAYEIPADHTTAKKGTYVQVPTEALFRQLTRALPSMPIIAEDLGAELDSVSLFMSRWQLPGMKVLQFGFGGDAENPHLPHNIPPVSVAYSGTHDNNTVRGWFVEAEAKVQAHVRRYLGRPDLMEEEAPTAVMRMALGSAARLAVVPVQDVLGLGAESRVNTPGTSEGNWAWRIAEDHLYEKEAWAALLDMNETFGRVE